LPDGGYVQEVPASSIPVLTDVLTPGKPTALAEGRRPVVSASMPPVLTDVLVPGSRTADEPGALPPVLTEVLAPGEPVAPGAEAAPMPPLLTDVLTPGRPVAAPLAEGEAEASMPVPAEPGAVSPADALLAAGEAASTPPLLTDVLKQGAPERFEAAEPMDARTLASAMPLVLTEVLTPGRRPEAAPGEPASALPAAGRGEAAEAVSPTEPPAMPPLLTTVLERGKPDATSGEALAAPPAGRAEAPEAASQAEPFPMPPTLTEVLEPGKSGATAFAPVGASPPAGRAEAPEAASQAEPFPMPPTLTEVLEPGKSGATVLEPVGASPPEKRIEAPEAVSPPPADIPPPGKPSAIRAEALGAISPADASTPTSAQAASALSAPFPGRPLATSPLLAGATASHEASAASAPTDDPATSANHEPARATELAPPADGVDLQAATPAAELLTAFDAPPAFADELPASHSAPEAVTPPPLASFAAAAADARVDAREIAGRLQRRVADYLGGAGRALIEARCEAALRDHGARLVDEVTREVARTLEVEIAGWVREAVDDELARRAARGADTDTA
jgi:hypothetical protein